MAGRGEDSVLCCFVFLPEVVVEIRESHSVRGTQPPRADFEDEGAKAYGWPVDVENDPQLTNSTGVGP